MTKSVYISLALLLACLVYSCQDDWNKHYEKDGSLPEQNLYETIKQRDDLSKFAHLIVVAGYDTLLSSSQTFTVWAPVNNQLPDVSAYNRDQARQLVSNHIARFNNSTTIAPHKLIRMINTKIYFYTHAGGLNFGGSQVLDHDILAHNGLLHTIDHAIPYAYNLYEYVLAHANTSKFGNFISSFEEKRFDEALSIPIDIDNQGRTVYDTVFIAYNRLFEDPVFGLGSINAEDSLFTMIAPTNAAWDASYARISPYFKVYSANQTYADSVTKVQTSLAIVNDLIYRYQIANPTNYDTIISTSGSVIHDVPGLFSGTTGDNVSNGFLYLANDLHYNNTETFNKPIVVECEMQTGRVSGPNSGISTRTVTSGIFAGQISNNRYIDVQPTTTSAQPSVTFDVPNVLSGKYTIYVEFIPAFVDGAGYANDSTKLQFTLTYMQANGTTRNTNVRLADFVTSGTRKVKMKVLDNFEFPVSNFYDNLWWMNKENSLQNVVTTTKLMVITNVTTAEVNTNKFTRKFRVDRIILEPVQN